VAAVGLDPVDERDAGQQVDVVGVLEDLAGLRVPEPHQVADGQPGRPRAGQRGLDLAGTLERCQVQSLGQPG
jgi:hypothetical protein